LAKKGCRRPRFGVYSGKRGFRLTDLAGGPGCTHRILIVEDEPTIRRFYERFCEAHGFEPVLAPTGTAAMEILESGQDFDVVLLDIRLPGVSGRALWKMMELNRPELCPKVIMVTADILSESTHQLIENSGCLYLEKPFSTEQLMSSIQRVLRSPPHEPGKGHLIGG
jgi:DNA-binding response OmpR family regulator